LQASTAAWLARFVKLIASFAARRADHFDYESRRADGRTHTKWRYVGVGLQVIVLALLLSLLLIAVTLLDALSTSPSLIEGGKSLSAKLPPTGGPHCSG